MVSRDELIKVLDDACVMYDTSNTDYIRVKSIHCGMWWHISKKNIHNGDTGRLVSDIEDMDKVHIKNSLLVFECSDRSSAVGIPL